MAERGRDTNPINQEMSAPSRSFVPRHYALMSEAQRAEANNQRILQAEASAIERKCIITPALRQILVGQESFYHGNQQSAEMVMDFQRRTLHSYETMREASIKKQEEENRQQIKVPSLEVNPTKITLSLELEYQHFEKMMNQTIDDVENLSSIMFKTNTLIQLPDRDECNQANPFVQQVAINGFYKDVENARWLIRENCPLVVYVSLRETHVDIPHFVATLNSKSISFERVEVEFWEAHHEQKFDHRCLRLTSHQKHESYLLNACESLSHALFGGTAPENTFTIIMDLSTFHIDHIIGIHGHGKHDDALLMPKIECRTNTRITYPDTRSSVHLQQSVMPLRIEGDCSGVLQARRFISDLMPVSMCFNINNSDMREPASDEHRIVEFAADDTTMVTVKFVKSKSEPKQLLEGEESQHLASIRSREFMMRKVYDAYSQLLSPKLKVEILHPKDNGKSMWNEVKIPHRLRKFEIPCRGDPPAIKKSERRERHRTVSTSSVQSDSRSVLHRSSSRMPVDQSGRSSKRHSSASSVTETESIAGSSTYHYAQTLHNQHRMAHPPPYGPVLMYGIKNYGPSPHHPQIPPVLVPYVVFPHPAEMSVGRHPAELLMSMQSEDPSNYVYYPGARIEAATVLQARGLPEAIADSRDVQNKNSKHNIPSASLNLNLVRQSNQGQNIVSKSRGQTDYDAEKLLDVGQRVGVRRPGSTRLERNNEYNRMDDDSKSMRSSSRRTSMNEDDYIGMNDARFLERPCSHRLEARSHSRSQAQDIYKNKQHETFVLHRNSDLHYNKKSHVYPRSLLRGSSVYRPDLEFRSGVPANLIAHCDQQQFSGTHLLKLRPNTHGNISVDIDQQLFTQDISTIDDRCPSRTQFTQACLNASHEAGFSPHDEVPVRYHDSERGYHHQDNNYSDAKNERKTTSPTVSKTLLESKLNHKKETCQKTHLDPKARERIYTLPLHDAPEQPVGTNIHPKDLIRYAYEEKKAGAVADVDIPKDRTFADIVKERKKSSVTEDPVVKRPESATQLGSPGSMQTHLDRTLTPETYEAEGDILLLNQEKVDKSLPISQSAPAKLML